MAEPLAEIRALVSRVQREAAARWLAAELATLIEATCTLLDHLIAEGRLEAARPAVRAMAAYLARRPDSATEAPWVSRMRRTAASMLAADRLRGTAVTGIP